MGKGGKRHRRNDTEEENLRLRNDLERSLTKEGNKYKPDGAILLCLHVLPFT